jgi:hypothetical protein
LQKKIRIEVGSRRSIVCNSGHGTANPKFKSNPTANLDSNLLLQYIDNTTIPLAIFSTLDTCGAVKALLICQDMEDIVSTEGIDYAPD